MDPDGSLSGTTDDCRQVADPWPPLPLTTTDARGLKPPYEDCSDRSRHRLRLSVHGRMGEVSGPFANRPGATASARASWTQSRNGAVVTPLSLCRSTSRAANSPSCSGRSGQPSRNCARQRRKGCAVQTLSVESRCGAVTVGLSIAVAAPFGWRCPMSQTMAPFPHPAHRTGLADLPHPALGQDFTPSFACNAICSF